MSGPEQLDIIEMGQSQKIKNDQVPMSLPYVILKRIFEKIMLKKKQTFVSPLLCNFSPLIMPTFMRRYKAHCSFPMYIIMDLF